MTTYRRVRTRSSGHRVRAPIPKRFEGGLTPIDQRPPLSPGASLEEHKERQCGSKVPYPSEQLATNAATLMNWSGRVTGDPIGPYRCPWCSTDDLPNWHIGHNRYPGLS